MHFSRSSFRAFPVLSTSVLAVTLAVHAALAVAFGQKEVDQSKFIAVAKPLGSDAHQLLILEQVSDKQPCWSESGSAPTLVDPLLLKFDFTGICGRSTDANGYSIRIDGEDYGNRYTLRMRERDGDIILVGTPDNSKDPEIVIGRANGSTKDFAKIQLDSGWRFTKRTFNDKVLGHVYLTKETGDIPFPDVAGDIYLKEIKEAVKLKFIAGFQDNTFRPLTPLTREQLVSMVLEAIKTIPGIQPTVPPVTAKPYPDVDATRWSAAKIAFARDNKIVSGYQDGTFVPDKPVTRAELLAILKRTAEYVKTLQNKPTTLQPTQAAFAFSDATGHWAEPLMSQMSAYCGVASPANETGTAFTPNQPALRNYAAAATLRTLNCLQKTSAVTSPTSAPVPTPKPTPSAPVPTPKPTPSTPVPTPKPTPSAPVPTPKPTPSAPVPTPKPTPSAPVPTPKSTPSVPKP